MTKPEPDSLAEAKELYGTEVEALIRKLAAWHAGIGTTRAVVETALYLIQLMMEINDRSLGRSYRSVRRLRDPAAPENDDQ